MQTAKLSTSAGAALSSSPTLQAAHAVAAASSSSNMSRFGKTGKWALMGTTALAIGAAAAVQLRTETAAVPKPTKQAMSETDKRYQELLDAYGSGDSLDDLQKAVASYGGPQSRG